MANLRVGEKSFGIGFGIAGKGGKISVSFDTPQVTINGDKATAKFRQHYQATGLSTSTTKILVFVRSGSKWLIKEENAR